MKGYKKASEVWKDFQIVSEVRPMETAKIVVGAILVASAWFLIQLVNSCLLRTVAKFGEETKQDYVILIFLFGLYGVARIPTILGYRISGCSAERIVGSINQNLLRTWLYKARIRRFEVPDGKVMSLILNDSGTVIGDFLFMGFTINFVEPFLLGALSMLMFAVWRPIVLVPFLILGLPSVFFNCFFQKRVKEYSLRQKDSFDGLTSFFQYISDKLVSIRESGIDDLLFNKGKKIVEDAVNSEKKKEYTLRNARFISDILEDLGLISSVLVCLFLTSQRRIDMADMAFIFALSPFIFRFFNCFTNTWNYLTDVHTSVIRLKKLLGQEKKVSSLSVKEFENGTLCIRNVSFAYPGQSPVLKNLSFTLPLHKKYVLTGTNGVGKSTLLRILLGDLTPQEGKIVVLSEGKEQPCPPGFFTYIPQEPELLNISFRENITLDCKRFGKKMEQSQIEEVAVLLGIHKKIMSLPEQYDTIVMENGKNLSLGEKQKIVLARALLSPAPCVLMDEPEHGLDQVSAKAFFSHLSKSKKTMFMISHTKENLAYFDKVLILKSGVIL